MKPLSPQATELLAGLAPPRPWYAGGRGGARDAVAVFAALAGLAEPALAPHLAGFVVEGPVAVRRAAATALDHALAAAAASDVPGIDDACRRFTWAAPALWADGWRALTPARLAELDALGPAAPAAWLVASCHPSGYVREAAVARLDHWSAADRGGRELAFLMLRANDWVPEVAERARAALERRVVPGYAPAWLRALPLVRRLGPRSRRDATALTARVLALLRAPEQRETLLAGLAAGDRATRRAAVELARDAAWARDAGAEIAARAFGDPDPVIRVHAAQFARDCLSDADLAAVLPRAASDPFPPVRYRILDAGFVRLGAAASPWLERALLDTAASVRDVARFALARLGRPVAFAELYRRELRPDRGVRRLVAAVRGLAETGDAHDVGAVAPLLAHPRPSVRAAVVWALGRLDAAGTVETRFAQLADPSPGVARAVRDGLRGHAAAIGAAAILAAARDLPHAHGRLDALALAAQLPKWDGITALLEATAIQDPAVGAAAAARIATWLARENRSFVRPTEEQLAALAQALGAAGHGLPEADRRCLHGLLAYWRVG